MADEAAAPVATTPEVAAPTTVDAKFTPAGAKALGTVLSTIARQNIDGLGDKALDLLVDLKVAQKGTTGDVSITVPVEYIPVLVSLVKRGIQCPSYAAIFDELMTLYGELKNNLAE
jgi:hypothetical protein